jgi:hypothetical protein
MVPAERIVLVLRYYICWLVCRYWVRLVFIGCDIHSNNNLAFVLWLSDLFSHIFFKFLVNWGDYVVITWSFLFYILDDNIKIFSYIMKINGSLMQRYLISLKLGYGCVFFERRCWWGVAYGNTELFAQDQLASNNFDEIKKLSSDAIPGFGWTYVQSLPSNLT